MVGLIGYNKNSSNEPGKLSERAGRKVMGLRNFSKIARLQLII